MVRVDGFWIDRTPVTNRQFKEFVRATGHVTFAEVAPDPKDYPDALPGMIYAGSLTFTPPDHPVDLRDFSQWWTLLKGANWRHPYGRKSNIKSLDDHPVLTATNSIKRRRQTMRLKSLAGWTKLGLGALAITIASAQAQVPLSTYMDSKGFINVQALTCAQLANTYQEDADYLAAWYSGWYNGLAQKHFAHVTRAKSGEHQVIVYCKAHPELKVIQAIDVLFKNEKCLVRH